MRRFWTLLTVGAMALFYTTAAQAEPVRVTVDAPAKVPIVRSPEALTRRTGAEQVVVTVSGYEPSPAGPVQIVALAMCDGKERALGRFAVLPATGFGAGDKHRHQHFGLTLPAECGGAEHLTVRLIPSRGDGSGAHADIAGAEIN